MHPQEPKSNEVGEDRGSPSPASCALPLLTLEACVRWGQMRRDASPSSSNLCVSQKGVPLYVVALDVVLVHEPVKLSLELK